MSDGMGPQLKHGGNQGLVSVTMKNGSCPKCGSGEVFRGCGHGPSGTNATEFIRISYAQKTELVHYVCGACGYVESYVEAPKGINKIRNKWSRA